MTQVTRTSADYEPANVQAELEAKWGAERKNLESAVTAL